MKMFTIEEAAEYTGLKPQTLNNKRSMGEGPTYIKNSNRAVRNRQADLDEYILKHLVTPVNESF